MNSFLVFLELFYLLDFTNFLQALPAIRADFVNLIPVSHTLCFLSGPGIFSHQLFPFKVAGLFIVLHHFAVPFHFVFAMVGVDTLA